MRIAPVEAHPDAAIAAHITTAMTCFAVFDISVCRSAFLAVGRGLKTAPYRKSSFPKI